MKATLFAVAIAVSLPKIPAMAAECKAILPFAVFTGMAAPVPNKPVLCPLAVPAAHTLAAPQRLRRVMEVLTPGPRLRRI
jgi:hypothetical protein